MKDDIFELAKLIQAQAKTGLHFVDSDYEKERYMQIMDATVNIISTLSSHNPEIISMAFHSETLYVTPKVDLRSVVFNDQGKFLMVKEKVDGKWTLPGGFCDVGFTPGEVAVKETWEEAGIDVKPVKLLGVLDKAKHDHPKTLYYLYTIFMLCEKIGGVEKPGSETLDVGYFGLDELPELSIPRVTKKQLEMMHEFYVDINHEPYFD
ncbi:NUDIX hydrolase [Alkalibacter mobilis]|uniref:NUDIX hydrolase n=1 Tax=Alkalibacter mobilis TaxID=2787712 RepID=UPI00189F4750|nr:NUDIX hydrolase N-terminal domain-containing protein [Alkalibacter mobilis]MBF7097188.1 NUDIX hydrolase N-terminal domain-containing protein [Alkalibacter mobilis]